MRKPPRRLAAAVTLTSACMLGASMVAVPAVASPERAPILAPAQRDKPNFSGIVALSNCSGSIVRWDSSKASDKAMMLTNGHCVRFYGAREVDVNIPAVRSVRLLDKDGSDLAVINTTTLLYGTMHRTDVGLYETDTTYAKLLSKYGVHPLTIGAERPDRDSRLEILSGYFKRGYYCHLNGYVFHLREGDWTWHHSLRYNEHGCHMVHGTSGSPVLLRDTRTLIGIHNTTNDSGEKCTLNNPCEIDRQGDVTVHQGRHYGEETWWFTTCVGSDRQLHLDKKGCLLTKP